MTGGAGIASVVEQAWCLGQMLFVPFVGFVLMVVVIKLGQGLGLVENSTKPFTPRPPRPAFSRTECLKNVATAKYGRNTFDLTDDEQSIVARECVLQQSEYEGW
jgi:hypothetical protein